ncbi:hypothetical protein MACJ_001298 [Theileria orientalis]|uniref:ABC transporter n=1 Tax=Theileria orientalis TaxID=68886 RepID=A0A976M7Y3_THEOR|nr:hypothetical protein MACJ_001298 [Theileria orientalis]
MELHGTYSNNPISDSQEDNLNTYPDYPFWESRLYHKSFFRNKNHDKKFSYYDDSNVFKFLFFDWVNRWTGQVSKGYIEPYMLHPLPVSDQILRWQPKFSKHISDGIIRLERFKTPGSKSKTRDRTQTPYRSIMIRAIFLTFWKRTLFGLLGILATNIFGMSVSMLVYELLKELHKRTFNFSKNFVLVCIITVCQFLDGFFFDHLTFFMYRLIYIIQYCCSITVFQHGLSYRRKFANEVNGSNVLSVCNEVIHSRSDSACAKNPLFCPSLRYQNKDICPQIFSFEFIDSYYISSFFDFLISLVQFSSNCVYGFLLIRYYINLRVMSLVLTVVIFIALVLVVEGFNTFVLNYLYSFKDYRISQCRDVICSIYIIVKMSLESVAHNIITETRNTEISLVIVRLMLSFLNKIFFTIAVSGIFLLILNDFVEDLKKVNDIRKIDGVGLLAMLYILMKIIFSISLFPQAIKQMYTSIASYRRIKQFIGDCSPNFYISDNKFTGSTRTASNVVPMENHLPKDTVVYYKNATFTWVNSRNDLLDEMFEPYLKNVNFQLKRGEIAIITGAQGSGKSNFIKSMLGEMTLVGGSMAVIPLHTSMPIFYASQDIWLHQGTIRSNITFGYRFDENLYNIVLKAVELQSDISTWEKGDLRVVSDNAHTLSGGQRVRMEMARAIYAYLIFHQVNTDYNNGKCSFLMCLDSPFHGLDPFVSKTVFNNLFNTKTGVLVKDDLSVVLSSTKRSLDICLKSADVMQFPDIPVYNIVNFNMVLYRTLRSGGDFESFNSSRASKSFSPKSGPMSESSPLNEDPKTFGELIDRAYDRNTGKVSTNLVTANKYGKSDFIAGPGKRGGFKPYIIYFSAAGFFFVLFIFFMFACTIMDNIKFIFASDLSDYIKDRMEGVKNPSDMVNRFSDIKTYSDKSLKRISIFTLGVVSVCFLANVFLTASCVISSRKIHEYCIDSIFRYSASVIKIKGEVSRLITYLSSDIFQIDESLGYAMSTALVSLVESIIHVLTLCYLIPLSTPVLAVVIFIIIKFVFVSYVNASKNLQIASMEATSQINDLCEKAISGSVTFRCFKKEQEFMRNIVEHTDYYMRCLFLNKSVLSRSSINFKFLLSIINLVLLIPLVRREFFNVRFHSGIYGLAVSLAMIFGYTFTNFMIWFGRLEVLMCTIKRFESFIPPGTKCRFLKKKNVREEGLIVKFSENVCTDEQANISRNTLYRRREREYSRNTSCFPPFKGLMSKPIIHKLDVSKHLPSNHFVVQIKNLFVSTSESKEEDQKHILKNISVSASGSDIIGIIGRTGSGKTTLLSVLQNTVENRTGQVILDGKDLNEIPKDVLTQIIGVLPQLPFVFKGWTIRRFLDPRKLFTDDEINQALENCGLLDLVNGLHGYKKLDTVIIPEDFKFVSKRKTVKIEKPVNRESKYRKTLNDEDLMNYYADSDMILSSSQLRTLSFARLVLYRQFYRILLIDEPPSDNCVEGEEETVIQEVGIPIYELIQKYFSHCTTFLTAHDANALVMCTSVWVLHNGQLIRTCKRDEIIANESIASIIEESVRRKSLNK